jgi:hypothetical protein
MHGLCSDRLLWQLILNPDKAPIYNYARFLPWTLAVENVYYAFREASERCDSHQPVNSGIWEKGDRNTRVHHLNRRGSLAQVTAYVEISPQTIYPNPRSRWGPGVVSRFLLAAFLALSLTWGTTGKLYRGLDELDLTNHF